jgi:hypothetical protein
MRMGALNDEIELLRLTVSGDVYKWVVSDTVFAKAERVKGNNIFSSVGLGAKTVKLTLRACDISLHNAARWNSRHCLITDIVQLDREYLVLTAALIEPVPCSITRQASRLNELNRLVFVDNSVLSFPACITEKYLGHTQGEPQVTLEQRLVLITPKPVKLSAGELVSVGSLGTFNILLPHELDEYKNEYEIIRKAEP